MSKDSRHNYFFIYPKDSKGKLLGSTICVLLRDGKMFHGEAACSPNDQFVKKVGRELALQRATAAWQAYCPSLPPIPPEEQFTKFEDTWVNQYSKDGDKTLLKVKVLKKGKHVRQVDIIAHPGDRSWTKPGMLLARAVSDGNGYTVKLSKGPDKKYRKLRLDYGEISDIKWLLDLANHYDKLDSLVGTCAELVKLDK